MALKRKLESDDTEEVYPSVRLLLLDAFPDALLINCLPE